MNCKCECADCAELLWAYPDNPVEALFNLLNSCREDTELPFARAVGYLTGRVGGRAVRAIAWAPDWRPASGDICVNRRYSEEQIRMYLEEAAKGVPVRELCARYGFSDASFYGWRAKYGSKVRQHDPSDSRRLRQLEEENARLKSMLADALLKLELLRNRTGRHGDGKSHG